MAIVESRRLADGPAIQRTVEALTARGMEAVLVPSGQAAMEKLLEMVPEGSEIFDSTSETLDYIGFSEYVKSNPRYRNVRDAVDLESDPAKRRELHRMATVAEYIIGSVQAIAETGEVLVASGSGSQIGAYAYGAKYVILVAGTQKICPTLSDALARVRGFTLDKHDQWLQQQGRKPGPIGKLALLEREPVAGRIRVILINQDLGW